MDDPSDFSWQEKPGTNDTLRGIPIAGDIFGGFGMRTSGEKNKQKALERVLKMLAQYRPEMLQTRQNSIDNTMKLFGPMNASLVKAYGEDAALPLQEASQSPYPDDVMASIQTGGQPKPQKSSMPNDAGRRKAMKRNNPGFFPF